MYGGASVVMEVDLSGEIGVVGRQSGGQRSELRGSEGEMEAETESRLVVKESSESGWRWVKKGREVK